ncbi:hypothetical protein FNF29_00543 [Cafeteria roenbergensis]|uniref:Peptidyl-prolyl cis-trans isomerase n=2 Tax=Cafeteria roenbergensis TaxID=33653 RepID=A0A5A8CZH2_CAFRO|nr:hypothetical protein FNF29_00543 [Cafeteria roenbergensis]|eukprot:KAA0157191.1 hypothetical protein FNF29_00543 [Cafeteria roenbergensis]
MAAIAARDIGAPLPKVWLRIDIDGEPAGIVTFVLRADVAPRASENFRGLCTGEYGRGRLTGKPLSFAGTAFFRIIPGMMAVGGDIENNDGTGGECVFEQGKGALAEGRLADESFLLRHTGRGVLSTAVHRGPDTGASAFNLTFAPCRLLDERAVVFGYAVAGREVLDRLEACGDAAG